jgi:hypothetical protein
MDVLVFYGTEEYFIELKIRHRQKRESEAYSQVGGYWEARGQNHGYHLIILLNLKNPPRRGEWIRHCDCMIYEEIVPYSADSEG